MSGAANRSRWLQLRAESQAARRGRDLLDEKREALVREIARRLTRREDAWRRAAASLAEARAALRDARTEVGRPALESAALGRAAQSPAGWRETSVFGIPVPALVSQPSPWRPAWGPGGSAAALDRAGAAFGKALPSVIELAQEELAVRALERGLAKTSHRINALERIILPGLAREIREVSSAIEEEERDEAFRRRRWLGARGERRRF
ncbi:MAG TPA: V-type ATP synthase subunit D [Thermoanaerobaculia bacterium]|nr:V-type ATP synthase subunit D [Thermoanaerobaculia bacterium]